jgi:hypothetical protein
MIALEGSEYQKWDQVGHKSSHGSLESSISATCGMLWDNEMLSSEEVPLKVNGLFIDLSQGWNHINKLSEIFEEEWVMKTSVGDDMDDLMNSNKSF